MPPRSARSRWREAKGPEGDKKSVKKFHSEAENTCAGPNHAHRAGKNNKKPPRSASSRWLNDEKGPEGDK